MAQKNMELMAPSLQIASKTIFNDAIEQKKFFKYAMSIYANNKALLKLDEKQVNGGILQMYLRDADPTVGEAYIIAYDGKYGTQAQVQTGYKFAIKKLWNSGELKEYPVVIELRDGDITEFKPDTRDVKYKVTPITSYAQQQERNKNAIVGYVSRFVMSDGTTIEKMFWKEEIEAHVKKYSQSFTKSMNDKKGVWYTNYDEMMKKTALMRTYTQFLPKTSKVNQAIQDINALNNATYNEVSKNAKPKYLDNPQTQAIEEAPKDLPIGEQPASKDEIKKIFVAQKILKTKKEQDEFKNDIWKFLQSIKREKYPNISTWYSIPWNALQDIEEYIMEKYEIDMEVIYPDEIKSKTETQEVKEEVKEEVQETETQETKPTDPMEDLNNMVDNQKVDL